MLRSACAPVEPSGRATGRARSASAPCRQLTKAQRWGNCGRWPGSPSTSPCCASRAICGCSPSGRRAPRSALRRRSWRSRSRSTSLTGSAALVGAVGAIELVPLIAGSLLGGALADRTDRRKVLIVGQAGVIACRGRAHAGRAGRPAAGGARAPAGGRAGRCGGGGQRARSAAMCPTLAGERLRAGARAELRRGPGGRRGRPGARRAGDRRGRASGRCTPPTPSSFALMLALTRAMRPMPPPPARREPLRRSIADGPALRAPQPHAGRLVRHRPGGDDVRHAAGAVRGAVVDRLPRRRERHRRALRGRLRGGGGGGADDRLAGRSARRLGRITIAAVFVWGFAIAAAGFMPTRCGRRPRCSRWPARRTASARCAARRSTRPRRRRPCAGACRRSSSLVVTSGPRLGDVESGVAASAFTAQAAVVSGGLACVVAVGAIALAFPELAAYDGRSHDLLTVS